MSQLGSTLKGILAPDPTAFGTALKPDLLLPRSASFSLPQVISQGQPIIHDWPRSLSHGPPAHTAHVCVSKQRCISPAGLCRCGVSLSYLPQDPRAQSFRNHLELVPLPVQAGSWGSERMLEIWCGAWGPRWRWLPPRTVPEQCSGGMQVCGGGVQGYMMGLKNGHQGTGAPWGPPRPCIPS